jgi:hypothetical protein
VRQVELRVAYQSVGISTKFIAALGMRKFVAAVAKIVMVVVEKVGWVNSGRALSTVAQRMGP